MNGVCEVRERTRKPVLAVIAVGAFIAGPIVTWLSIKFGGSDELGGLAAALLAVIRGAGVWVVSLLLAIGSLTRGERMKWIPITVITLIVLAAAVFTIASNVRW